MSLKGLYAITDEKLTPDDTVVAQAQTALQAGIKILQYRNKTNSDDEVENICIELQALCKAHDATFIIDDRPHLAQKINADGLHIGKDDMSIQEARVIFPKGIIGVSCYGSIRKALEAQNEGADYVAFGSFFHSPTKPHSGIVSMSVLEKAKEALSIPICAIGGISVTNIHEISAHTPDMISVVSAVFEGDIKDNIVQLTQAMKVPQ
ncbi:MAG: thiamine phosphate synthase [Sulfuricurvum sp.]|nr:thiamine phosphate synthase [Sulfuricurvum sp.]MDP3022126.1 thiamine phosphate synthase [Sulfuricurvum sp.]MDP3120673.1 thiamine phosphate synthase [Sulfuricurvum sp.]